MDLGKPEKTIEITPASVPVPEHAPEPEKETVPA